MLNACKMKIFQKVLPSLSETPGGRAEKARGKAVLSKQIVAEKTPEAAVISNSLPVKTDRIQDQYDAWKVANTMADELYGESDIAESHRLSAESVLTLLLVS